MLRLLHFFRGVMSNMYSAQTGTRTCGSSSNSLILPRAQSLSGLRRSAFVSAVIRNSLPAASRLSVQLYVCLELEIVICTLLISCSFFVISYRYNFKWAIMSML